MLVTFIVNDFVIGKPAWREKEIFTGDDAEIEGKIMEHIRQRKDGRKINCQIEDIKRI